ncbi:hypothetical protein STRTUCAR8_01142, partial [Streptomyces turgidiscabies Car8]
QRFGKRIRPALTPPKTQDSCADTQSLSLVERRAQFLPWCHPTGTLQEAEEPLCARKPCAAPPALSRL